MARQSTPTASNSYTEKLEDLCIPQIVRALNANVTMSPEQVDETLGFSPFNSALLPLFLVAVEFLGAHRYWYLKKWLFKDIDIATIPDGALMQHIRGIQDSYTEYPKAYWEAQMRLTEQEGKMLVMERLEKLREGELEPPSDHAPLIRDRFVREYQKRSEPLRGFHAKDTSNKQAAGIVNTFESILDTKPQVIAPKPVKSFNNTPSWLTTDADDQDRTRRDLSSNLAVVLHQRIKRGLGRNQGDAWEMLQDEAKEALERFRGLSLEERAWNSMITQSS